MIARSLDGAAGFKPNNVPALKSFSHFYHLAARKRA